MLQTFANRFNSHASKSIPATDPESVGKGAIGICRQNSHQTAVGPKSTER